MEKSNGVEMREREQIHNLGLLEEVGGKTQRREGRGIIKLEKRRTPWWAEDDVAAIDTTWLIWRGGW